ncbi:uncharacterized protein LOC112689038 [Sipha flava]|uniref:Uncharacterized protein LOC112689038 n=1 Tax=Sipha flava TaxID=143950 RepID=A0A8B8G6H3_9HEMI|nr:uncharacterized protein LOC112689038 [Sipha flava]
MGIRKNTYFRIDKPIVSQLNDEISYWRNVLHRLATIIQSLSSRGLSFRGYDENIESIYNSNILMVAELLAKFDPFMSQHIAKYGSKDTGSTSYVSSTIYEKVKQHMANKLSVILCYVHQSVPVEHFLTFISGCNHKSQQLCEVTCNTLRHFKIPIEDCRGQSYALSKIEKDVTETPETRSEAGGLRHQFEYLETHVIAISWGLLLSRLNAVNKKL